MVLAMVGVVVVGGVAVVVESSVELNVVTEGDAWVVEINAEEGTVVSSDKSSAIDFPMPVPADAPAGAPVGENWGIVGR